MQQILEEVCQNNNSVSTWDVQQDLGSWQVTIITKSKHYAQ